MLKETIDEYRAAGIKVYSPHPGMQEKFTRSSVDTVFAGGVLNPQPATSHILTPKGFTVLSQLHVGDVVCGLNGEQTITHIENEGMKGCIRIETEHGYTAESALDHKWWIYREGIGEMTAIGFELLEAWEIARSKGECLEVWMFRYVTGELPEKVRLTDVRDIGQKEVICIGVSSEDQLYITDDYLITKNCGKAQPLDSLILTPTGWVRMGDLNEGDTICDPLGGVQTVLKVYYKGLRRIWKVQTRTGIVKCCGEHLWTVYDRDAGCERTITTETLYNEFQRGRFVLPSIRPVEFSPKVQRPQVSMSPYTLGRLLGKGRTDALNVPLCSQYQLLQMGMRGENLFIPDDYILAPLSDRQMLLRGFLEESSDGFDPDVAKRYFCWIGPSMRKSLKALVLSLGGSITFTYRKKRVSEHISGDDGVIEGTENPLKTRNVGQSNSVGSKLILLANIYIPAFERSDEDAYGFGQEICKVEKSSAKTYMRCILVSGKSHLYITDNFIPTHNTFAAILMVAEPTLDPNFRAAFTRRNLGNLKQGGGIVDDFRVAYGDYVSITTSDSPRVSFPSGAYVDCLHIADESPDKLTERAKGWQYDVFYMDELTSYQFSTFSIIGTRARGKGWFSGHVFGTTNPKRSHWTRKMLDWYIGLDGFIIPERDGVVRWYFQPGDTVDDIVFGNSPDEVYYVCKSKIDRQLEKLGGGKWTYRDLIRTFVFYSGKMSENISSIENNPNYVSAVSAVGGKRAQQFIEGNFNVDEDEDDLAPISGRAAQNVFVNDECRNGSKWITADLADIGSDNVVALAWDGFHIEDVMIIGKSTPRMNFERIRLFALEHQVGESHIIYDGTNAAYMRDYMPDAIPYISGASACGQYALSCSRLKDECYLRLISALQNGNISMSESVANARYTHQGINREMTIRMEWLDECAVVRISEDRYGKKKLANKKEMNAMLGLGRSMDLLDPCAMRMLPVLGSLYGDELHDEQADSTPDPTDLSTKVNIYDETLWA